MTETQLQALTDTKPANKPDLGFEIKDIKVPPIEVSDRALGYGKTRPETPAELAARKQKIIGEEKVVIFKNVTDLANHIMTKTIVVKGELNSLYTKLTKTIKKIKEENIPDLNPKFVESLQKLAHHTDIVARQLPDFPFFENKKKSKNGAAEFTARDYHIRDFLDKKHVADFLDKSFIGTSENSIGHVAVLLADLRIDYLNDDIAINRITLSGEEKASLKTDPAKLKEREHEIERLNDRKINDVRSDFNEIYTTVQKSRHKNCDESFIARKASLRDLSQDISHDLHALIKILEKVVNKAPSKEVESSSPSM